jgi:hypothetical protein
VGQARIRPARLGTSGYPTYGLAAAGTARPAVEPTRRGKRAGGMVSPPLAQFFQLQGRSRGTSGSPRQVRSNKTKCYLSVRR